MANTFGKQLLLIEVGGAAAVAGYAAQKFWPVVGGAVGAVFILLAIVPYERRWLFQVVGTRFALSGRRRAAKASGFDGLVGGFDIVPVPDPRQQRSLAAVRSGTSWSIPLAIGLDDLFNEDRPVPLGALAGLLHVEDVPLASVRIVTAILPSTPLPAAPAGPAAPKPRLAARYLVLTLDGLDAVDPISARGGSDAAVAQILRRCALRAAEVLDAGGLRVRPLDEEAATAMMSIFLGIEPGTPAGAVESWRSVRTPGGYSTTFTVDAHAALTDLYAVVPGRVVVESLVLEADGANVRTTHLVRVMGAEGSAAAFASTAKRAGVSVRTAGGVQADLLRATSALGY